jgi:AcrR family transcriptional regulator
VPRPRTVEDGVIADAVFDLVGRIGPGRLTLARVAAEVGLSPATLVQRFGSKRGLLLAAARHGEATAGDAFARAAGRAPLDTLIDGLCGMTAWVSTPETLANHLAFLEIDLSDPEFHALALRGARRLRERLERLLDEAVEAGELRPCDTARLASAIQSTYNGALITWAIHREGPVDDWLREQLAVLLDDKRPAPVPTDRGGRT